MDRSPTAPRNELSLALGEHVICLSRGGEGGQEGGKRCELEELHGEMKEKRRRVV